MSVPGRRRSASHRVPLDADASFQKIVDEAVSQFGYAIAPKLRVRKGSRENHLRGPLEVLLVRVGRGLGLEVTPYGEERFKDLGIRPDYVVDVAQGQVGCVELKAPGKGVTPTAWSPNSHDGKQWKKLKLLPNVLYTDGQQWALYRGGELVGRVAELIGQLDESAERLRPADGELARILSSFLRWAPEQPRTLGQVVHAAAGLCRLLRDEVLEGIGRENSAHGRRLFMQLAWEWRQLLFPRLSDTAFADAYAQTVTFALLLARVEGIVFEGLQAAEIAHQLRKRHPLMGRALSVLTENSIESRSIVLTTLIQVVGAVDWDVLEAGGTQEAYAYLYEQFLTVYDPQLRRQSGSYYTPAEVVSFMVDFVDEILRSPKMGRARGFASDNLVVIDPAMGSGSFLDEIIRILASTVERLEGPGQVAPRLREAIPRLIGFEKQAGPFAVAEMRLHRTLKHDFYVEVPEQEPRFLTDTLDDPDAENAPLWTAYEVLQRNQEEAKRIKREVQVQVVIGNPPFGDKAGGQGGWIENGRPGSESALLDDFRSPSKAGRYEYVLSSQVVYFWRWATWKVFETYPDQQAVVAFISPAAFTSTAGFSGMRRYLQREADEGWIIDLSPEGHYPPGGTRIFPKVGQELCIAVFARYGTARLDEPAIIHYIAANGSRQNKFDFLRAPLTTSHTGWSRCPQEWGHAFAPAIASSGWQDYCPLNDLMPWSSRGVTAGRTWIYAPDQESLKRRWETFLRADSEERRHLFKEARDRTLHSEVTSLPGIASHNGTLAVEHGPHTPPIRVAYRSFDRQWLIPDNRLMVVPRPPLWSVRSGRQIFVSEQRTQPLLDGPGLVFEALIPDIDHFMGHHGGRVTPLYRDFAGLEPNVTPGLLSYLQDRLGVAVSEQDLLAYLAATVAHRGYTNRFARELKTPGLRVPLTAEPTLWRQAVALGQEVLWLHTYGERCIDPAAGRPAGPPQLPESEQPRGIVTIPYTEECMPDKIHYCKEAHILHVGTGQVSPVSPAVWEYRVNRMPVVEKWFRYRKRKPSGRRSSDLDDIHALHWSATMTGELLDLLNVLGRCVSLEPLQAELLDEICASPSITKTDLFNASVLPVPPYGYKPNPPEPVPGTTLF